jgi:hypothetical protein
VERGQLSEKERNNLEQSLQEEVRMLQDEIERNQIEAQNTKKMFVNIQKSVATMVQMFKQSKFFLCVAQKMNYEDGISFTENNIVSYLAELEEYISSLITYTAFKRDEPNAAIAAIPLDKLDVKDPSKADKIKPYLPNDQLPTGVIIDTGDPEGNADDKNYNIINPRELYKRFQQLYENKQLTITRANKNNNTMFNKDDDDQSNN